MLDLDARVVPGKAASKLIGTCCLFLLLFRNPLVLRPRFWNVSAFVGFLVIDTALLVCGLGLLYLRKWAALLLVGLAGYFAITLARSGEVVGSVISALPVLLTVAFWHNLVWGRVRDLFFSVAGVMAIALIEYVLLSSIAREEEPDCCR